MEDNKWMSFKELQEHQKNKRKKETIYFQLVNKYGLFNIPEGAYEEASKEYDEKIIDTTPSFEEVKDGLKSIFYNKDNQ